MLAASGVSKRSRIQVQSNVTWLNDNWWMQHGNRIAKSWDWNPWPVNDWTITNNPLHQSKTRSNEIISESCDWFGKNNHVSLKSQLKLYQSRFVSRHWNLFYMIGSRLGFETLKMFCSRWHFVGTRHYIFYRTIGVLTDSGAVNWITFIVQLFAVR